MDPLSRRNLLRALLLGLLPSPRNERSAAAAEQAAQQVAGRYMFALDGVGYESWADVISAAYAKGGPHTVAIAQGSAEPLVIQTSAWNMTGFSMKCTQV